MFIRVVVVVMIVIRLSVLSEEFFMAIVEDEATQIEQYRYL